MTLSALLVQMLNGLASASSLFLIAAGLSLIFGVSRIVNFAHGSFYMLGVYLAYSIVGKIGSTPLGFWASMLIAAAVVALIGLVVELVLLRRIYRAPELLQLLATFALVLVIRDAVLMIWGPEDLLGPRAPGLKGSIEIMGRQFPQYDLVLIFIGPLVLAVLWWVLMRTRWGVLIRAATQDREMVGALGVNQAWLFTGVFMLGAFLAGLGGALQLPREPANQFLDLAAIGDAFVVVVVGGMGSVPGAFLAALLIAEIKALCIAIGQVSIGGFSFSLSRMTLVVEFLVMAAVLIWRPWGLLGKPAAATRNAAEIEAPLRPATPLLKRFGWLVLVLLLLVPLAGLRMPFINPDDRHSDRGAVCCEPALHHGSGRHALLRSCCLFRPGCLWGGAPLQARCHADGGCALARAIGGGARCAPLRLVLRASVRGVPGHAHARVCPDCLVDHVSVGRGHRRFQWRGGRLARSLALAEVGLLLLHACAHRGGRAAPAADADVTLRLRDARGA